MERPDESVNEKVFKRVVKTFGERPRELAHSKPEVFCDADAFHPSPIQGKHKACAEKRDVLHFRVSFDMGREEAQRVPHSGSEPDGPTERRLEIPHAWQMFVPEVEFDQFLGLVNAGTFAQVHVGTCTTETDAEDAKVGITKLYDPQHGAKHAVQEVNTRPRESFQVRVWRTWVFPRSAIKRMEHRVSPCVPRNAAPRSYQPDRAVAANPIAVSKLEAAVAIGGLPLKNHSG
jgi:hypothetical protein